MTKPSKRELKREVEQLKNQQPREAVRDVSVRWSEPNLSERPEGMFWDEESGTITYDVWSIQREVLDKLQDGTADIVAFLAGYGSGKSILGARWTIANAIEYPGSKFLALGQSFTKARDSTFEKLFQQLPGHRTHVKSSSFNGPERSPIVADYNRTDHRLVLTNDSVITLGSADNSSRYAGAEFGGIWMDEPSLYETNLYELVEMLGSRLRGVEGPKTQCWTLTGNGYNDAWEILIRQQDGNGEPIGLNIDVVRGSTLDNPYLDEGDLAQFERQFAGKERAEQALHGGFVGAEGLVYSNFKRDRHVIPHDEAVNICVDDWRVYGYDAGWNSPSVLLEIGKSDYDQLVVLDEFHETETHVSEIIEWLEKKDKPKAKIYAEHDNADIDEFQQAGFPAVQATKDRDAGIADVRHQLEEDSSGKVGLLISEHCHSLIRELIGYKETDVGSRNASDHCLDALRYAIHSSGAAKGRTEGGGKESHPIRTPIVVGVNSNFY